MPLHQLLPDVQNLSPEQIDALQENIRVDIIAVHGLNPWSKPEEEHAFDTWRKPAGPDGRIWLRDDLTDKIPGARVFLYQYDSKLIWGGDKATFIHKADEFLEAIRIHRKKNPQRPIIFIGHSLGGLLIEQALVNSHNSIRYASIAKATTGLVFFGTPHDGGSPSLVGVGSIAARIARSLGAQKNRDIEQVLQRGSLFTDILQHSFRNQLKRYRILSFWEGKGDIVPMSSAIFGLPDDVEYIVELKATHSDMCRFDTINDKHDKELFSLVWGSLEDLYTEALERDESQLLLARDKRKILEWLYFESVELRHLDIRNVRRGKGQWLLQHEDFQAWLHGTSNRTLWAQGIAGSGKTFLSSFVIDYLLSSAVERHYGVAYIYLEFQESSRQECRSVLCCLLRQLADQNKDVLAYVKSQYQQYEIENRTALRQDILEWLIASIPKFERLFIVIDAPDEQADEALRDELIQDLEKIVAAGGFCYVSSRPNIRSAFINATHLEIRPSYEDLKDFIEDYINCHPSVRLLLGPKLREDVVNRLIDCVDGIFLPIKFLLQYLFQSTTAREILDQLDTMGDRLKETDILDESYERAMKTVRRQPQPKQKLAFEVFSWLLAAKRTLTITELCTAISVRPELTEVDELAIPSSEMIIDVCGGFVTLDEPTMCVRIAHATARDYIIKVLPEACLAPDDVAISLATYLTFKPFCPGWTGSQETFNLRREKHVLLDYAARYLGVHAMAEQKHKSQVEESVLRLCKSPGLASTFIQAFYAPLDDLNGFDWFPKESTPLHVAATIGLLGPVTAIFEQEQNPSQILKPNLKGQTPLHIAAIYGYADIAEYLLKKGARPSDQDRYGMTPFLYAISEGHIKIVEIIQRDRRTREALLSSTLNNGDTALHIATAKGHVNIVLLLLQYGAPFNVKNKKGLTPQDLAKQTNLVSLQNAFISWQDMRPSSPPERLGLFNRSRWLGFRGMFEDLVGRSADQLHTPNSLDEPSSLVSAERASPIAQRGSIARPSGEHYRPQPSNIDQIQATDSVEHHAEDNIPSPENLAITFSDLGRNCHYVIPANLFERVIELSDRQCSLVDLTSPGGREDAENQHLPQDPLRMSWVCRLEADTNLRCLFTGLPKGHYVAFWRFIYRVSSEYDGTYLPRNLYNCTFGRAVDPEMFASRTSNPLQPFISTTLNFIDPRCTSTLPVPQFEPLQSEIPNVFIHQAFMQQDINLQSQTALKVDWDGPVAFLIKKVGIAPIEGLLCFKSVEMVRINDDDAEDFLAGDTEHSRPPEVR